MDAGDTIGWGIIGCGAVTEVKSGPALQRVPGSALVAVMRRDGAAAADYARRHGVPRWYDDADALMSDPGVDAVYVATPPSTHAKYAIAAMRAGKPVYVEKPMALDTGQCEAMLAASRDTGMPLFVAYYRRALPRFVAVRALLGDGAIGHVREVHVDYRRTLQPVYRDPARLPWRVLPEIAGGGLFVDLGSHTLDLLDFLFGPLQQVTGEACNRAGAYPAEDTVDMRFVLGDGIAGHGHWSFCADVAADMVEITGTRGHIAFATFGDGPVLVDGVEGRRELRIDNPVHIQQPLVETLVARLQGRGDCPSTGASALRTTRVIDQVLAGWRARRRRNAASGRPWRPSV